MTCSRCAGFLVSEYLLNPAQGPQLGFPCWRCLNCGAIGDEVILLNRVVARPLRPLASPRHRRVPVFHLDQEQLARV